MKQRNISGIYFRYLNPENGQWKNWCFEDLPKEEQRKHLEAHSDEWAKLLAITLAEKLRAMCDQFDISAP